jgi:hypothetical protein
MARTLLGVGQHCDSALDGGGNAPPTAAPPGRVKAGQALRELRLRYAGYTFAMPSVRHVAEQTSWGEALSTSRDMQRVNTTAL